MEILKGNISINDWIFLKLETKALRIKQKFKINCTEDDLQWKIASNNFEWNISEITSSNFKLKLRVPNKYWKLLAIKTTSSGIWHENIKIPNLLSRHRKGPLPFFGPLRLTPTYFGHNNFLTPSQFLLGV